MGVQKLPDGRYRVQIRRKGFPCYDQVFPSRSEANQAFKSRMGEFSNPLESAQDMTLRQAWEKYHQSSHFSAKADKTQQTERGRIEPVLAVLGEYSLSRLAEKPSIVMDYIDSRSRTVSDKTKKRLSTTSVRLEISALSSVAIWAVERRLLVRNFVRDIKRPSQSKRKRRVAPGEQGSLYAAARQSGDPKLAEGARFLLAMRYLGCRPGEMSRVLKADVRFLQKDLTFRKTKHKGEDRLVHIPDNARQYLEAQYQYVSETAPASPYLFTTRKKGQDAKLIGSWGPYNYEWPVKRLRGGHFIDDGFHAHAMRREYISRAIEAGLPYATIRKQTGHHSTQAIEIYDEGLSTAPEIRNALDQHDAQLQKDLVVGLLAAQGLDGTTIQKVMQALGNEKASPINRHLPNGEMVPVVFEKK